MEQEKPTLETLTKELEGLMNKAKESGFAISVTQNYQLGIIKNDTTTK